MKTVKIFALTLILSISASYAQQLPLYSQFMNNQFLINPAVAGSEDYIPIRLTMRQQWVGVEDAPSTQALSGNLLIANQRIGVGGYLFSDRFGIDSKVGAQGSFSYILPLGIWDSKLAFGLSFMVFQYSFNTTDAVVLDDNDQNVAYANESAFVPDANFGVFWHNDKFFMGLSGNQLIEYKVKFNSLDANENHLVRHYFVMGGYKFKVSKAIDIEPSTIIKVTTAAPINIDLNVKGYYSRNYWFGLSYRTGVPFEKDQSIVAMLGVKYKQFVFGYAYDYTISNLNQYTSGSHEIMLGINLKETTKKGSSLL